jgi:hypothetical protein
VTEIVGTSTRSWEDAVKRAVETAAKSLRDLRVAEVSELDVTVDNGKITAYRAKVKLSFKFEGPGVKAAAPAARGAAASTATKKAPSKKKSKKKARR